MKEGLKMYQKSKKLLAALCMIAMMSAAVPAIPAKAAAVPEFQKTYASVYVYFPFEEPFSYKLA